MTQGPTSRLGNRGVKILVVKQQSRFGSKAANSNGAFLIFSSTPSQFRLGVAGSSVLPWAAGLDGRLGVKMPAKRTKEVRPGITKCPRTAQT